MKCGLCPGNSAARSSWICECFSAPDVCTMSNSRLVSRAPPYAELSVKVVHNLIPDGGLGSRRQAQHRRNRFVSRPLAYKASDVLVVGPDVVSPLRQAACLVQNPCAYLSASERCGPRRCEVAHER